VLIGIGCHTLISTLTYLPELAELTNNKPFVVYLLCKPIQFAVTLSLLYVSLTVYLEYNKQVIICKSIQRDSNMPQMTDSDLVSLLSAAENDAAIYNGTLMSDNVKYLQGYLALKVGDFAAPADQSSVVSTDIADVVEADMPALARIFLGSGDVVSFMPNTENEAEVQEAEEKTKYVNWIIRNQPDSFMTIHNWMKDAEIQKNGVVKYFIDEQKEVEEVEYTGVDEAELTAIVESLKGSDIDKIKVEATERSEPNEAGAIDIKFRVTHETKKVCIINVPPESFLITRNARSLDDAELVGDRVRKTRGELLAEGFSRDLIDQLSTVDEKDDRNSNLKSVRDRDQGGADIDVSINDWASQFVEISDLYVKIDFDGDGIAERRHVMISGNKILINESFNHVPYASLSAILMPHKAIGRSRAEITYETQRQKTFLTRGMNDNIRSVLRPRHVAHPDVDLDDLLTIRDNGVIRMEDDTQILPQQALMPLVTPYIGDKALQVIQYVDQARAQTTGALLANQGLDADKIMQETATRFQGVQDASDAKLELIARNYAETGFRKLYEGIAWLVSRFQDTETEFRVLGKALTVNPKSWKYKHHIQSNVGLGAGNNEKLVENLQGLYGIQQQLKAQGSTLTDEADIYNTLKRIVDGLGLPRVDEFFNNPEEPDETLKAENEILNNLVLQLQEQVGQLQNPLAEAEMVKREGDIAIAQGKLSLEAAKLEASTSNNQAKLLQSANQHQSDTAFNLTKLEVDSGVDVPGSAV